MTTPETPRVRVPPPVIWVIAAGLSLLCQRLWPIAVRFEGIRVLGGILVLLGLIVVIWTMITMNRAHNSLDPNKSPTALVVSGPFRFSRNPIYVAFFLWLIALGAIRETPWPIFWLVPFAVVMHYGVVLPEEQFLTRHFREDYAHYMRRTRRWV